MTQDALRKVADTTAQLHVSVSTWFMPFQECYVGVFDWSSEGKGISNSIKSFWYTVYSWEPILKIQVFGSGRIPFEI